LINPPIKRSVLKDAISSGADGVKSSIGCAKTRTAKKTNRSRYIQMSINELAMKLRKEK